MKEYLSTMDVMIHLTAIFMMLGAFLFMIAGLLTLRHVYRKTIGKVRRLTPTEAAR